MRARNLTICVSILTSATFTVGGCGLTGAIDEATAKAAVVLDGLQSDLNSNSLEWRELISHATGEIPQTLDTLKNDLTEVLHEGEIGAGKTVMCSEAYLGRSLIHAVAIVKAQLLNQPLPLPTPMVCMTTPDTIDPSNVTQQPTKVTWFGFYLGLDSVKAVMVDKSGATTDVSSAVRQPDAYSLVAGIGGLNGIQLGPTVARLDLITSAGTYSVAFNPPGVPACTLQRVLMNPPPGAFTVAGQWSGGGDADYWGHGPNITISEATTAYPSDVTATIRLNATEDGGDGTQTTGYGTYVAYQAPPGYTIRSVEAGALSDAIAYKHNGPADESPIQRGNTSLVRSYQVHVLDAHSTSVSTTFNPLFVTLFGPPPGAAACSNPTSNTPPGPPPTPPTPPRPHPVPPPHPCAGLAPLRPRDGGCLVP